MLPTTASGAVAWLAMAALVIRLLTSAINSDRFDLALSMLLGRPVTVPDKWIPDIALALGFAGGLISALAAGASGSAAFSQGCAGLAAAFASNIHMGHVAAADGKSVEVHVHPIVHPFAKPAPTPPDPCEKPKVHEGDTLVSPRSAPPATTGGAS